MSTKGRIDEESRKDPATLEREIDRQRAEIGDTLEALEQRFSPGELFDHALRFARGNGGEFFNNLGATVKANPVPTLLTSVGLAWLMAGQRTGDRAYSSVGSERSASASVHERTARLKEKASTTADSMRQRREQMSGSLQRGSENARYQAQRMREGVSRMSTEQPLALGAIGIALGALVGAAMPPSRREDELMGEASDRVKHSASNLARQEYEQVRAAGKETGRQVAQDVQQRTNADTAPRTEGPPTGGNGQAMPQTQNANRSAPPL